MSDREFRTWQWYFSRSKHPHRASLTDYHIMQIASLVATRLTGQSHSIEDMHIKWEVPFSEQFKQLSEEEKKKVIKEVSDQKRASLAVFSRRRRK